jgi:6-pyruvoyltetrahydropterin/6-carboxytetrahydropterin synthase
MRKIRVTKEFHFEAAHALHGYDGACRDVHGHSYHLSVTVIGEPVQDGTSPKLGMVLDFGDLKKLIRKTLVDPLDHALMLNASASSSLVKDPVPPFSNIILLDYQPTSENLLLDFAGRLGELLPRGLKLHSMRLRETVSSYAEWFAEDNE